MTKKALDLTLPIFQLKISLQHINPPIWRRVQTDDCSLDELHDIIQIAMGWEEEHMHAFVIDGEQYGDVQRGGEFEHDSRSVRLSDLVEQGHARFRYDYDFGDEWKHIIEIEKTLPAEEGVYYPCCAKGERACPPEDCGGPYEYPYLLDKLQDPKHEEHEDTLEWVGGEFDPEAFDLEEVNDDLRYLRRWLGKRKGKHPSKAAFAKGDLVRVKRGIAHDRYPDIPLGGWVGKIIKIAWITPAAYEVGWTRASLDQAHPVYLKRCQRDRIDADKYWFEGDQLEAATDDTPSKMEQPTNIITRPLSENNSQDRVRVMFGLTSDDALPEADEQTQGQFFDYLKAHLSFPFKADYWPATGGSAQTSGEVTVLGFADPPIDPNDGIVCHARKGKRELRVPLAMVEVSEDDPNFRQVEDYGFWLSEVQEPDDEDLGEDYEKEDDFEDEDFDEDYLDEGDEDPAQFPIGTIAYYGPDDKITTKIVAGVIKKEGAEAIIKRWVATDVTTSPKVQKEIARFFKKYGVQRVGMSEGNMGCPHEEGEDFPVGGDCPFCPFWKGKQGSGAKEEG